jgi:hypothetical protein
MISTRTNNLIDLPLVEFHDVLAVREEFHPRGINYHAFDNPPEAYIATDYLQSIIDENWVLRQVSDSKEVTSPEYWNSFTNKLLGSRLNPYLDNDDSKNVVDLSLHHEFIIYLKSLESGFQCSVVLYNKGYFLDDDLISQPFSEQPEYFTGKIFSVVEIINFLTSGIKPEPFTEELDIPENVINETKSTLKNLEETSIPLIKELNAIKSEPDGIPLTWKLKQINKKRHELLFEIMMKYKITVPGSDAYFRKFSEFIWEKEMFEIVAKCKNSVIKDLYSMWVDKKKIL